MTICSNFFALSLNIHLGDKPGDLIGFSPSEYPFKGDEFQTSFVIEDNPRVGYFLIQTFDINVNSTPHESDNRIIINGTNVGVGFGRGIGLAAQVPQRWNTWMNIIPGGVLEKGANLLQFKRDPGPDNFLIGQMIIHWEKLD